MSPSCVVICYGPLISNKLFWGISLASPLHGKTCTVACQMDTWRLQSFWDKTVLRLCEWESIETNYTLDSTGSQHSRENACEMCFSVMIWKFQSCCAKRCHLFKAAVPFGGREEARLAAWGVLLKDKWSIWCRSLTIIRNLIVRDRDWRYLPP